MTPTLTHLVATAIEADRRRANRSIRADLWDPDTTDELRPPPAGPSFLARLRAPIGGQRAASTARGARL